MSRLRRTTQPPATPRRQGEAEPLPAPLRAGAAAAARQPTLEIEYFTDPLCSWSWAFEPHWRRLRLAYAGHLRWRSRMGGLIASWDQYNDPVNAVTRPVQMGPQWYQVRVLTGMPIEDRIWFENPPGSSYPACLAVKAAQRQGADAGERCLRRLREAVMLERRNIAETPVLLELAAEMAVGLHGFDLARFAQDLGSPATWESFKDDLKEAAWLHADRFPTLAVRTIDPEGTPGASLLLTGFRPYTALLAAVTQLAPQLEPQAWPGDAVTYVATWGSATAGEVAETLSIPTATALHALELAVSAGRLARHGDLFTMDSSKPNRTDRNATSLPAT